jgi:hypothetical protein
MIRSLCACCVVIFQFGSTSDNFCTVSGPSPQEERWFDRAHSMDEYIREYHTWICYMVLSRMFLRWDIEALQVFNFGWDPKFWHLGHSFSTKRKQKNTKEKSHVDIGMLFRLMPWRWLNKCALVRPNLKCAKWSDRNNSTWSHPSKQRAADRMRHACTVLSACYQLILLSQSLIDSVRSWSWESVSDVHQKWSCWSKNCTTRSQHTEQHKSIWSHLWHC